MGTSNFEIERVFKNLENDDLEDNFVGVFASVKINKYIDFSRMMKDRKYPFMIANTNRLDKDETLW